MSSHGCTQSDPSSVVFFYFYLFLLNFETKFLGILSIFKIPGYEFGFQNGKKFGFLNYTNHFPHFLYKEGQTGLKFIKIIYFYIYLKVKA